MQCTHHEIKHLLQSYLIRKLTMNLSTSISGLTKKRWYSETGDKRGEYVALLNPYTGLKLQFDQFLKCTLTDLRNNLKVL